jgi:hypothetical protein
MAHYKQSTDRNIIFHGNSLFNYGNANLVSGWAVSNFVRTNLANKKAVFDYSQGGKTTSQIVTEFPTRIAPFFKRGDIYIFWDTINDLNVGRTVAQTIVSTKAAAELAIAQGYRVYTLNCININNAPVEASRLLYNAQIVLETPFCDGIIDIASISVLNAANSFSNPTFYNADGVHLTTAGYNLIGQKIIDSINVN